MADRAFLVDSMENETLVMARDLTEEDRKNRFLCAGKNLRRPNSNEICRTELTLFICAEKENYFSAAGGIDHMKGCEYCEKAENKKDKIIQVLSRSCLDKSDADILAKLQGAKTRRRDDTTHKQTNGTSESKALNEGNETKDDEDVDVKRTQRLPKHADELYALLTDYLTEDVFARKPVSEWIVDKRTFAQYYSGGLKDGQIALVVLGKMSSSRTPEELNAYNDQYYIFPSSGIDWREKIFFLLPKDKFLLKRVIYDQQIKQFAALAAWHRARTKVRAYYCDAALSEKQITFEPNAQADRT
jgi:hypothetical protein